MNRLCFKLPAPFNPSLQTIDFITSANPSSVLFQQQPASIWSHCFPFPPLPSILHLAGRMSLVKHLPHHTTAFSDYPLFSGLEMKALIGLRGPHRDDHCAPHSPQLEPVLHMFSHSGYLQTCGHTRPLVSQGLEQRLPQPTVLFPNHPELILHISRSHCPLANLINNCVEHY